MIPYEIFSDNFQTCVYSQKQKDDFLRFATEQKVTERTVHRKRQWIKKATSILEQFESNQLKNNDGDVQILFRAMGIHTEESASDTLNQNQQIIHDNNKNNDKHKRTKTHKNKNKHVKNNKNKNKNKSIRAYMSTNTNTIQKNRFEDFG